MTTPAVSATGGGVSDHFSRPAYQQSIPASVARRGLPDVAGNADPQSGYILRVNGRSAVIGGTSAVAPLWAGFVALLNQAGRGRVGLLNPLVYSAAGSQAFHDITQGNNGTYHAAARWDACTGWGSPDVAKLLALVAPASSVPAAPTPPAAAVA